MERTRFAHEIIESRSNPAKIAVVFRVIIRDDRDRSGDVDENQTRENELLRRAFDLGTTKRRRFV